MDDKRDTREPVVRGSRAGSGARRSAGKRFSALPACLCLYVHVPPGLFSNERPAYLLPFVETTSALVHQNRIRLARRRLGRATRVSPSLTIFLLLHERLGSARLFDEGSMNREAEGNSSLDEQRLASSLWESVL